MTAQHQHYGYLIMRGNMLTGYTGAQNAFKFKKYMQATCMYVQTHGRVLILKQTQNMRMGENTLGTLGNI